MKVLDSSYCAEFLRGYEHAKQYRLDHEDESLVLTAVGFYELYRGAVKQGREPQEIDRLLPWVERLDYAPSHGLAGAHVQTELEADGKRLQHPDMMIAGAARSLDVPVVTTDTGFDHVDGLVVENPREIYG